MKYSFIPLFLFLSLGCQSTKKSNSPKLVVLISVDQMRGDYLPTFESQMEAGLAEFYTKGLVYTNAHHKHAMTTTAAGHATIATGLYPSHNGIVNNTVYNRAAGYSHYSILDSTVNFIGIENCELNKVSAKNLLKPSIGDILKKQNKNSKSYSVALKDRASILMGGHDANRAFWFDAKSTQMVSTDYYSETFPTWVSEYKAKDVVAQSIEYGWQTEEKFKALSSTSNDSFSREKGTFAPWFPHTLESIDTNRVSENVLGNFVWATPFGDEYVLDFAYQLIAQQKLGEDTDCDVLTVGLSSADLIGHHFGPNSHEILDYYNKLDFYLDDFMNKVKGQVGEENVLFVLTSDHGVAPFPEVVSAEGGDAQRIEAEQYDADLAKIDSALMTIFQLENSTILKANYAGVEPHFEYLSSNHIDSLEYVRALSNELKTLNYVSEVISVFDILDKSIVKPFIDLYRNSYKKEYGFFIKILGKKNYLVDMRSCGTTHGSPYDYDTHVPVIFYGSGINARRADDQINTVDIAPTIISILSPNDSSLFDGTVLSVY
ncbi:alkaline phosphatase family protein [Bacteroidia bacterium]|nr:alkaline phosphatase family protein [Bacteroidia bacterium]